MLVTFRCKAWGNVTMFGDVAGRLLKMMGHSGTVPSAILAADVPAALDRLRQALEAAGAAEDAAHAGAPAAPDDGEPPPVGIRVRAYPLIELLSAAAEQECDVTWSAGAPLV